MMAGWYIEVSPQLHFSGARPVQAGGGDIFEDIRGRDSYPSHLPLSPNLSSIYNSNSRWRKLIPGGPDDTWCT